MNLFVETVKQQPFQAAFDDEVDVRDFSVDRDHLVARLESRCFSGCRDVLNHVVRELPGPVESLQLNTKPMPVESHGSPFGSRLHKSRKIPSVARR
ncbi:hypothetical protein Enr13x_78420 [Stieleria neptunia]|uniref:Uncharacterized protein n=1 Tax=Stieleria neptunia TaxID=2527979 RepID=A0A518I4B1_9BACT|nr:hypothetical protein Enr13x_78420 [Stieleria neptunia]